MYRRLTATVAVSGALLLTLTGCLGDEKTATGEGGGGTIKVAAAQVMAQVSDRTEQTDTYAMRILTNTDMTVASQRVQSRTEANMQVRMRPELAMKGTTKVTMSSGGQSPQGGDQTIEMIMVGGAIYMKMGMPQMAGGKPWARMSLEGMPGTGADAFKQAQQYGPAETTRMLTTSPDVREVGKETINGVQTTRYAGTVSPATDFAKLGPEYREQMEKTYKQLGVSKLYIEIWVGDDGLPRKQTTKVTMNQGTVDTEAYFTDYGKPVQISAPPADQVGEFQIPGAPGT